MSLKCLALFFTCRRHVRRSVSCVIIIVRSLSFRTHSAPPHQRQHDFFAETFPSCVLHGRLSELRPVLSQQHDSTKWLMSARQYCRVNRISISIRKIKPRYRVPLRLLLRKIYRIEIIVYD